MHNVKNNCTHVLFVVLLYGGIKIMDMGYGMSSQRNLDFRTLLVLGIQIDAHTHIFTPRIKPKVG